MRFTLNKPFETDRAEVEVDAGLPAGLYRFQLVVINAHEQRSDPCEIAITILLPAQTGTPAPVGRITRPRRPTRRPT